MSFIGKFLGNIYKAIASKGKYQSLCDCDTYDAWNPDIYYYTDDLVLHKDKLYVALATPPLNQSLSAEPKKNRNDKNDVPGESIHWELLCECKEFPTPTPISTPTPTPTPYIEPTPTPTPTPLEECMCTDYTEWESGKFYEYPSYVSYNYKIYATRDFEGSEGDDIPETSEHWIFICECVDKPTPTPLIPDVCCEDEYKTFIVGPEIDTIVNGEHDITIGRILYDATICVDSGGANYCQYLLEPVTLILPNDEPIGSIIFYGGVNIDTTIYISVQNSDYAVQYSLPNYDGVCLSGKINNGKCELREIFKISE